MRSRTYLSENDKPKSTASRDDMELMRLGKKPALKVNFDIKHRPFSIQLINDSELLALCPS